MEHQYFGTDGIRGRAHGTCTTANFALRLGVAAGTVFSTQLDASRVVVGKDTQLSNYMLESALVAGFTSVGMHVLQLGSVPTSAVAMLTRSLRADLGVMISASLNSTEESGIKLFGPDGCKLSDELELGIEALINSPQAKLLARPAEIGRVKRIESARERYIEFVKRTWPLRGSLAGVRIVVDCANGAAYKVAPQVFWELGAEVIPIGVEPNGTNINLECGTASPLRLIDKVRELRADMGIALDGDADRVIIIDETGGVVDGDQLIATIATRYLADSRLTSKQIVATVMSNLALERYLSRLGLTLHRTNVGDRCVVEEMRRVGCNVGGERTGHIILSDFAMTGDGLLAALQILASVVRSGKRVSEVCRHFDPLPQVTQSVRCVCPQALEADDVRTVIGKAEERLAGIGRLVIRQSSTERVVRVMAEGDDKSVIASLVSEVADYIGGPLGQTL